MKRQKILWQPFLSEGIGTAILVLVGLSLVILMFGTGSPMATVIPDEGLRRLITGFLFGSTGALIAISPVGKESGAHINPVVTLAFWLMGKIDSGVGLGYIVGPTTKFIGTPTANSAGPARKLPPTPKNPPNMPIMNPMITR